MKNGVAGVLFSEDREKVLLVKRGDLPVWVVPGGGVEKGESDEEAVRRETEEETGFKASIVRKTGIYQKRTDYPTRKTHVFECRVISGKAKLGEETAAVKYWPIKNLPRQLPFYQTVWIKDAAKKLKEVVERKQEISTKRLFVHYLGSPRVILIYLFSRLFHFRSVIRLYKLK